MQQVIDPHSTDLLICGGIFSNRFITNSLLGVSVKKFFNLISILAKLFLFVYLFIWFDAIKSHEQIMPKFTTLTEMQKIYGQEYSVSCFTYRIISATLVFRPQ